MLLTLHGRGAKPLHFELEKLWFQALRQSLGGDPVSEKRFDAHPQHLIYYGDLSNAFLGEECHDIALRRSVLEALKGADYHIYAGETPYGIDQPPDDIVAYWDRESAFSRALRDRILTELRRHLEPERETLLFAHSLGAVLAYDALAELGDFCPRLTLVTLGSPLSLPHFRSQTEVKDRPLKRWVNVSARGDRVCGPPLDEAQQWDLLNPALRDGQPDPHHALGYLSHPRVGELLAQWLLKRTR